MANKRSYGYSSIAIAFAAFLALLMILNRLPANESGHILLSFDLEEPTKMKDISSIIDILEKNNISATFFIVADYAVENKEIILELSRKNEIACHTVAHKNLRKLDFDEKRLEIIGCRQILENITGKSIQGFRAPYQSIDSDSFKILEEAGFKYDSSIRFYQRKPNGIIELEPSHILIPLSDYHFAYLLKIPGPFFRFLLGKGIQRPLFHVHLSKYYISELDDYIISAKQKGYKFVAYSDYAEGI